jgi:hypothetical protein
MLYKSSARGAFDDDMIRFGRLRLLHCEFHGTTGAVRLLWPRERHGDGYKVTSESQWS